MENYNQENAQQRIVAALTRIRPVKVSELIEGSDITMKELYDNFKNPQEAWTKAGLPIPYPYNRM